MVSGDFEALTAAVERLTLNDASVTVQRETSNALGAGFRCGWALGKSKPADIKLSIHALYLGLLRIGLRAREITVGWLRMKVRSQVAGSRGCCA